MGAAPFAGPGTGETSLRIGLESGGQAMGRKARKKKRTRNISFAGERIGEKCVEMKTGRLSLNRGLVSKKGEFRRPNAPPQGLAKGRQLARRARPSPLRDDRSGRGVSTLYESGQEIDTTSGSQGGYRLRKNLATSNTSRRERAPEKKKHLSKRGAPDDRTGYRMLATNVLLRN